MRTKNLLFALALPAVFAACSQDEFATEESGVSLAGRKSIGEIALVTDAQTRISIGDNGFVFNNEDALSAALIDRPYPGLAGSHDYAYDNYEITDYISSNYKFEKKGASWSSKAAMVEGNYIFLAPYVNHSVRKPMEATLPAEQNLKLDASGKIDEKSAIQGVLDGKNPVFIAHRFLAANGETEQGINFYSIYSYPKITVKNTDALRQDVIVKKVLLKSTKGFTLNAPFSNEKVRNALLNEVFAPQGGDTKDQALMGAWAKVASKNFGVNANYNGKNTKKGEALPTTLELTTLAMNGAIAPSSKTTWENGLAGKTSDLLGRPETKGNYIVINFPGDGYKLAHGESVSFNAVVPADEYQGGDNGDLELYVVVNNNTTGTGEVTNVWKKNLTSRSQQLSLYPGKSYPNQDYNGTELRPEKGGYFTILTGTESVDNIAPSEKVVNNFESVGVVTTTDELLAAVKGIQSNTQQVIVVNGKNVKFTNAVNEAVANTQCQKINIQGLVYVDATDATNQTMTVSNRIAFEEVVIEKGKVIFNGDANELVQVFVAPEAELVLTQLSTTNNALNTVVHNAGKLNLEASADVVYNYGELEIAKDMTAANIINSYEACEDDAWGHNEILSLPINLKPSVNVLKGGKYAISGSINYPITVQKDGTLEVNGNAEITTDYYSNRVGSITNHGTVSGTNATLTVTTGNVMTNEATGKIQVAVAIEGASHKLSDIQNMANAIWPSAYVKAAKVVNKGTISGDVRVDGLLVMGSSSARVDGTITMTADAEGEIDNTAKGVLAKELNGDNIPVVFATVNALDMSTKAKYDEACTMSMSYAASKTVQAKVLRVTGKMTVGSTEWTGGDVAVDGTTVKNAVDLRKSADIDDFVLEFVQGSSLEIGDCTLISDCIKVSGDVKCSGRSKETSKLQLTNLQEGLYMVTEKVDSNMKSYSKDGAFTAENCTIEKKN